MRDPAKAATDALPAEAQAILDEELTVLDRARTALTQARAARRSSAEVSSSAERALEAQRSLREQAMSASADDLPELLLQLSLAQRLAEREPEAALPELGSPYVAHLSLDEGRGRRDYLLGHQTFVEPELGVRIVDWRVAPVARIFYGYREGDPYEEEFPGRLAEGVVRARRIVVIEAGRLTSILDDRFYLQLQANGAWSATSRDSVALDAGGAGSAARPGILGLGVGHEDRSAQAEVTALLDREQFAAVSAAPETALLVLGSAGSGKTTVALHRLARLSALDPKQYPLSEMRVVVPEEGLARLSRRLLEPLGAKEAQVKTLDSWAAELAQRVFERPLKLSNAAPGVVTSLKRSPALYRALTQHFSGRPAKKPSFRTLKRRLAELLTDREFLTQVVLSSNGELSRSAIEETVRHTMLTIADPIERELSSIVDAERKRAIDGRAIAEDTPEELAGTLDVEDLPVLLFLRAQKAELGHPGYPHLVLDEAEDLSLFELFVLGKQLGRPPSVTLAGDEAQHTSVSFAGWETALSTLGVKDAVTCRLAVSYRCPRPITDFARSLLGSMAPEAPTRAARDGAPIGVHRFPSEAQATLFLATALFDLMAREPRASVAVIAHDQDEARRAFTALGRVPDVRLVLDGQFSFEPGIDVTDVDSAKGLEFDYVIVPDASASAFPDTADARRRLHVAATRAAHQLWLIAGGDGSPLLPVTEPG
jgi:DNA helicase IV